MQSMTGLYHFASDYTSYPDGVRSNFNFRGTGQARPVWQHLDLTSHAVYLAHIINRTIRDDIRNESVHLRNHAIARAAIKEIIEIPDMQIDRLIRSVEANPGKLANVLSKEIPALAEAGVWDSIAQEIRSAFCESYNPSTRQPHRSSLSLLLHVHPIHNRITRRIPSHQLLHHRAN